MRKTPSQVECQRTEGNEQKPEAAVPLLQDVITESFNNPRLISSSVPSLVPSTGNAEGTEVDEELTCSGRKQNSQV